MANIDVEKSLDFIRKKAKQFATAKAQRVYLEEFRKSKKALLIIEREKADALAGTKSTVSERESYAYAHKDYTELLEGLREAIQQEEELKFRISSAQLAIEVWRTEQANERAERHAYASS
jgi:hypothetical protein